MIDPAALARLERWKLSLLDLSAANRLLDARDARTLVPLPRTDAKKLAAALDAGAAFALESGSEQALDAHVLRAPLGDAELGKRLVAIRRAARAQLADSGAHTLWLALGLLTWCDADGEAHRAPLALWPVELERTAGGALRVVAAAGQEPRFNQTLGEKLRRDFDLVLAPSEPLDLGALLDAAAALSVTRPGWRVEHDAALGIFSFAKLTMWTDLDARADALLTSPVVAHLAAASGTAYQQPSAAAAGALFAAPAGELLAPLDADASQLAAIAAAGAGASFVLQGPPGTGKSQTIANLVVHCVAQGKSVLVVADKIAALEVVQQRLAAVGLGEFCLELHSHKANRAQVLARLGRVLERSFRPGAGPGGSDARLGDLRAALDGAAAALHRTGPFGRSLHDALGRLVELRGAPETGPDARTWPRAPLADSDAIGLDRATFERRRTAIEQLAAAALPVEPVATHPWRASTLARWPLDGRERALAAISEARAAAAVLADAVRDLTALVPGLVARTHDQLRTLGALAALAAASPRPGAELLTQLRTTGTDEVVERIALVRARGAGSIDAPRDPAAFLVLASRHRLLAAEIADRFRLESDELAALDAATAWAALKKWSGSVAPLRFVALRGARAAVRAAAIPGQLETDDAMREALEALIAERACRAALAAAAEPAARWFGELFAHADGDLSKIDEAVSWAAELRRAFDAVAVSGGEPGKLAAWRALVAQVAAPGDRGAPREASDLAGLARLAAAVERWQPALAQLADATGLAPALLAAGDDHLAALAERTDALAHAIDGMRDWVAFHTARQAALAAGAAPAVAAIERGDVGAAELADAWERATLLAWADAEISELPALAHFHGATHHAHVAAFADLDRAHVAMVRARALVRLAERVPRGDAADPGGEVGALLHEVKKQRGHRPLRALFAEIPTLLPRLAPCMLMSPLSVAQYLDPALPKFDVVVFDEASQLPTADAIGALARGTAAVIVGDSKQLPPTRFFQSAAAEDEDGVVDDLESVLDECVAARLPELRLAWHYRSRHEDLIAFANARYYGDRLQVFPAAHGSPDLGIAWRHVDGAAYDRAGARTNRVEAEAIVADALARLRDPAQRGRSLGIVTFSRAQQALIEDLLDAARADDAALDALFEPAEGGAEPVLVKNLETMQGDERDVVLLSVGYGPDESGALSLNFGPLSQRGGERRLNVAITRAREQLVVYSSFAPEALADAEAVGVRDLAALIAFARAGGGAGRAAPDAEARGPANAVAAAIARALAERGWIVRHQVGCGAYQVDLAVVDPGDPERYVLGIESDGAAYASAPAARDRDRLRAQVLAQLGWRLHRVWSLDWWADPERELQRAHAAIVTAIAAGRQRRTAAASGPVAAKPARKSARAIAAGSGPTEAVLAPSPSAGRGLGLEPASDDRTVPMALGSAPTAAPSLGSAPIRVARGSIAIGPYFAAAIPAGRRAPDDLFAPRYLAELGKIVEQVLAAEAPMHVDLLARRVGAYFGIGRVTQRVSEQVRAALAGRGRFGDEANIVWRLDQDPAAVPAVRVAGSVAAARRDIDEVPLAELASAARIVVERAVGIAPAELVRDTARLLGFGRITDRVAERLATGIQLAQQRELIRVAALKVTLPD